MTAGATPRSPFPRPAERRLLACVYGYPAADLKLKRNGTLDGGFGTGGILCTGRFPQMRQGEDLGGDRYGRWPEAGRCGSDPNRRARQLDPATAVTESPTFPATRFLIS